MKKYSLFLIVNLFAFVVNAQSKNLETKSFEVRSNCNSAKELIENVGNQKRISKVSYDTTSQIATISYDPTKTTSNEILKNIALSGFDNSEYFAPDEAYLKLRQDCQYPRDKKMVINHQEMNHADQHQVKNEVNQNQLSLVFDAYFLLKDAFVAGNANEISTQITAFSQSISKVEMRKLSHETHMVWMDVLKDLESISKQISHEKNIEKQRELFAKLSEPMYKLAQKENLGYSIYYQNCPMFKGGSNWLSKDSSIKNPFYGNQMLTCGSTIETLK